MNMDPASPKPCFAKRYAGQEATMLRLKASHGTAQDRLAFNLDRDPDLDLSPSPQFQIRALGRLASSVLSASSVVNFPICANP